MLTEFPLTVRALKTSAVSFAPPSAPLPTPLGWRPEPGDVGNPARYGRCSAVGRGPAVARPTRHGRREGAGLAEALVRRCQLHRKFLAGPGGNLGVFASAAGFASANPGLSRGRACEVPRAPGLRRRTLRPAGCRNRGRGAT